MSAEIIKFPTKNKKKQTARQIARQKQKDLKKLIEKQTSEYIDWLVVNIINDFEDIDIEYLNKEQDKFSKIVALADAAITGMVNFGLKIDDPMHEIAYTAIEFNKNTTVIEKDIEV